VAMVPHNNEEIMELMVFNHDHPKIIKHITSFNPTPRGKKDKKEEGYLLSHRVEYSTTIFISAFIFFLCQIIRPARTYFVCVYMLCQEPRSF
jgi:hypothetical protein